MVVCIVRVVDVKHHLEKLVESHNGSIIMTNFTTTGNNADFECTICNNKWVRNSWNVISGDSGCPEYKKVKLIKKREEAFKKRLHNDFKLISNYVDFKTHVIIKHNCGNEWRVTPERVVRVNTCPKCVHNKSRHSLEDVIFDIDQKHNGTIDVFGEYINTNTKKECRCIVCGTEWEQTPKLLKNGHGCPTCAVKKNGHDRMLVAKSHIIDRLTDLGFVILGEYAGGVIKTKILRTSCGHEFEALPHNVSHVDYCPVCNTEKKAQRCLDNNLKQQETFLKTASKWKIYQSKVSIATRKTVRESHDIINPNNHPTGLAGTEGAWQIDHIIAVRYGFDNNIPVGLLAHVDNLQMLPWKENLSKGKKLLENVPEIFKDYIK